MKSIGGPGGRPSKYKKKFCDLIVEYFSRIPNESWLKKEIIKANGTIEREYGIKAARLPTLEDFAWNNKIPYRTMYEWANGRTTKDGTQKQSKHPEFAQAYNRAKQMQKQFLVDNALASLSPPASFIFVAKNITDMRDKAEIDMTSGGQPIFQKISYIKEAEAIKNAKTVTPAK